MAMTRDIFLLAKRLVRNQLKMPVFILLSISQPLMYLLFFGVLFSEIPEIGGQGTHNYITYLTPGMAILAALFGSSYIAIGTLGDVERGLFDRLIVSPTSRFAVSFSYVGANLVIVLLQVAAILVLGFIAGGWPPGGMSGVIHVFIIAILLATAFGSISNMIGFIIARSEPVLSIMNFITMPLMFLSGMLLSAPLMPKWVSQVAEINPVHWAASASQAAYLGKWDVNALKYSLMLLAFVLLVTLLMHIAFLRFLNRR